MPDDVIKIAIEAVDNASKVISAAGDSIDKLGKQSEAASKDLINVNDALVKLIQQERVAKTFGLLSDAEKEAILQAHQLTEAQKELGSSTEAAGEGAKRGTQGFESFRGALVAVQAGVSLAKEALRGLQQVWGFSKQVIDQTLGSTVAYAKEVRDLSTNLGITAEETSKVIQAADDYGISVETVTGALQMAVKRGFAPNIETLAKLADEYVSIKDPIERAARLTDVFGRGWTSLTPMLKEGGQAIREAADEAVKLGLVLNDKDVQGARALEIQIDNLNDRVEALKLKIGKELVPVAINVTDSLDKFATVVSGTETPLEAMNRELQYSISFTGKDSEVTKAHEKAIADYIRALEGAVKITDGAERSQQRAADAAEEYQKQLDQAQRGISDYADAGERATKRQDEFNAAMERAKENARIIADTTNLAIQYTESQKKQADVQKELDALNEKIASHGAVRSVIVKNERLNAEELTKTQLELAVAQEDLAGATKKEDESTAEFALRVENLKGKVSDYSQKLGEHTAVVGGATKAELEQKAALEEQIAALQKTDEIDRAKGAFDSLTQAFRNGILTEGQYQERATALNAVTGLYTDAALKQATAQESLMKSFADPSSEVWRGQLLKNQDAIDGLTTKTQDATKAAADLYNQTLAPILVKVDVEPTVKAPKVEIDNAKLAHDLAGNLKFAQPAITPKIETTQATKDFDAFLSKFGALPAEKKTTAILDSTVAEKNLSRILATYNTWPKAKDTKVNVDAALAQQQLDDIVRTMSYITDKDVTVKVNYKIGGEVPEGFQYGGSYVVPPNPSGSNRDYFPVLAAPGERVTIETKAQQNGTPATVQSGDTYIYNTNVYNPLAAAMLADKQRRDRLARSNARMGVT